MSNHFDETSNVEVAGRTTSSDTSGTTPASTLTSTQLKLTAELIARGEMLFPTGFPPELEDTLAREVIRHRRQHLLQFLARQIAMAIHADRGPNNREGSEI